MRAATEAQNKLLTIKAPTAYVHEVLAQHMAMRMVQKDMGVDEPEAMEIMRASRAIGELLNSGDE